MWKGDPQVDPRYAGRDYITNPTLERRVVLQEGPELRDQGWAISLPEGPHWVVDLDEGAR